MPSKHFTTHDTPEWHHLKNRINTDLITSTPTLHPSDIPTDLLQKSTQTILSLLLLYYGELRSEFQMAKNALLHIPDVIKRWETMPQVWERTPLPEMSEEEAREFVVAGIREIIECKRDMVRVVERIEEWRRRWGRIDVVMDRGWEEKAGRLMREWERGFSG
ncbi:hypothetical protein CLAFUW4_06701 [Fulvia fulva]|uniref:uncharacterized protein n=1 Tax=Passalora fulva TaxID=5499 RepID=UPI0028524FA9|nr:uncharacterized protein CLAFUR5_20223 [Fulvia fulva]KAK4621750.1 hypothetical protein CLAFUR4_06709 [Fulvia fulva]KAK4622528.1 hypothetical protein CLAFUR0_06703 [Fulvia fulva]WMI38921.1 hypothetical protein CLAFUR5_20223 [Fulvia fulva]WPV16476.1 hypothetical protein CLAFUW4_06701 [Fulvia fulva]WPV31329.1 hypothetical protein CLAFUW7_06700 [Fulvia fulva]